jgi:transposase InsO family protein
MASKQAAETPPDQFPTRPSPRFRHSSHGYCEPFNGKLRDELLNGEIFHTLKETQIVIENRRRHYNTLRPHSSLGYRPPAPETIVWPASKPVTQMQALN